MNHDGDGLGVRGSDSGGPLGVAHAIPTRQVLEGFEPISVDNRRIILQEWLAEAFTMWELRR